MTGLRECSCQSPRILDIASLGNNAMPSSSTMSASIIRIRLRGIFARPGLMLFLGVSAVLMIGITAAVQAYVAACCFGVGIGGVLTVLPIAWADYFGRASFGAIRVEPVALRV